MEQDFEADQINTSVTDDLSTLADALLANFITVKFPRAELVWEIFEQDLSCDVRLVCLGHASRCEHLCVRCYRASLQFGLIDRGHCHFLDHVEADPAGGWRIHLFLIEADAIPLVPTITHGSVGPGDPIAFKPIAFIQRRLKSLERRHRLTGRHNWMDDDLPEPAHSELRFLPQISPVVLLSELFSMIS